MDYTSLMEDYRPDPTKPSSVVIYGPAGSGKTTLAATFPNPLFIDTNQGMLSLTKKVKRINFTDLAKPSTVNPKPAFDLTLQVLTEARDQKGPFAAGGPYADIKTIVIDDLTTLANAKMMKEIMVSNGRDPNTKKPEFDDFGMLLRRMQALVPGLVRDLVEIRGMWVVMTALPHEDVDEQTKEVRIRPEVMGSYRVALGGDVDEEYYLEALTLNGTKKVKLYTSPFRNAEAKTRVLKTTMIENPTFEALRQHLKETPAV